MPLYVFYVKNAVMIPENAAAHVDAAIVAAGDRVKSPQHQEFAEALPQFAGLAAKVWCAHDRISVVYHQLQPDESQDGTA